MNILECLEEAGRRQGLSEEQVKKRTFFAGTTLPHVKSAFVETNVPRGNEEKVIQQFVAMLQDETLMKKAAVHYKKKLTKN